MAFSRWDAGKSFFGEPRGNRASVKTVAAQASTSDWGSWIWVVLVNLGRVVCTREGVELFDAVRSKFTKLAAYTLADRPKMPILSNH